MDTPANTTPAARSTGPLSAIVGAVVLVVAIVFISQAGWMNAWYSLFKTVHVVAAIVWIGGGALLVILGIAAVRTNDPSEMAIVARQAAQVGQKVFAPAGIVVVLMGAAMMANTEIGWGQFWIIIGLIGYAITFAVGVGVLTPLAKKVEATTAEKGEGAPETIALTKRLLLIARLDVMMLFLVVVDMVTKPFA
jgi:uncharacterized membrane protein